MENDFSVGLNLCFFECVNFYNIWMVISDVFNLVEVVFY